MEWYFGYINSIGGINCFPRKIILEGNYWYYFSYGWIVYDIFGQEKDIKSVNRKF